MACNLSIPLSICRDKDIFVQKCLVLKYINHDLYPELNFSEIQDCIDMVIKHKDKLHINFSPCIVIYFIIKYYKVIDFIRPSIINKQ